VALRFSVRMEDDKEEEWSEKKKKKNLRKDNTGFSYVEGMDFTSSIEEIEAMGGDPFFLNQPQQLPVVGAVASISPGLSTTEHADASTNRSGDDEDNKPWVWDGVENEDAYFD
jgi:hypothetical protein